MSKFDITITTQGGNTDGESGKMISGKTITIDGSKFTFDDSGVCIVGNGCY